MIQRKQSVFLFLALVAVVGCLMLPIGAFEPTGMGVNTVMTNFGPVGKGVFTWALALCFVLLLTCPITLWAIFAFKNRKKQAKLCGINIFLLLVWYVLAGIYCYAIGIENTTFHPAFAACLPLVAIILQFMARKAISADEKLVRSADRIR